MKQRTRKRRLIARIAPFRFGRILGRLLRSLPPPTALQQAHMDALVSGVGWLQVSSTPPFKPTRITEWGYHPQGGASAP